MGEEHDERIQHKDFATFLNEDVWVDLLLEIFEQDWKIVVDFNSRFERYSGALGDDSC